MTPDYDTYKMFMTQSNNKEIKMLEEEKLLEAERLLEGKSLENATLSLGANDE